MDPSLTVAVLVVIVVYAVIACGLWMIFITHGLVERLPFFRTHPELTFMGSVIVGAIVIICSALLVVF